MMGITDASTSNEEPDEVLFSRLAAGDATSFAAFYDRHAPLPGSRMKVLSAGARQEYAMLLVEIAREWCTRSTIT